MPVLSAAVELSFVDVYNISSSGNVFSRGSYIDSSDNYFAWGTFNNTTDFDPSVSTDNKTPGASSSFFLTKYSSSNVYQWTNAVDSAWTRSHLSVCPE